MRKISVMAVFVCLAIATIAQSTEEENIKNLIVNQSEAYRNRDFAGWSSAYRQDSKLTRTFISMYGYFPIIGWDSTKAGAESDFKQNPEVQKAKIERNNFDVNVNGNMAWVEYDQVVDSENDTVNYFSREMRLLVKENDKWKIFKQVSINKGSFDPKQPGYIENNLNSTGYVLLSGNKINEAIEVFKLNVKLFPNAWNTFDSLGEAYSLAGNKKLAIENYEKSVKLNPKNTSGLQALEKLKAK